MAIYSEFSHSKWVDLSIVMLVYQRVKPPFSHGFPMISHKTTIFSAYSARLAADARRLAGDPQFGGAERIVPGPVSPAETWWNLWMF